MKLLGMDPGQKHTGEATFAAATES